MKDISLNLKYNGVVWMFWFIGVVAVHCGCFGSLGMWWFIGDVVVNWGCGGSLELWGFIGDVVAGGSSNCVGSGGVLAHA